MRLQVLFFVERPLTVWLLWFKGSQRRAPAVQLVCSWRGRRARRTVDTLEVQQVWTLAARSNPSPCRIWGRIELWKRHKRGVRWLRRQGLWLEMGYHGGR